MAGSEALQITYSETPSEEDQPPPPPRKGLAKLVLRLRAFRLGISGYLTLLVAVFILIFGVVSASISLKRLYQEKTTDVWAILFLELEREARRVDRELAKLPFADAAVPLSPAMLSEHPPDAVVRPLGPGDGAYVLEAGWVGKKPDFKIFDLIRHTGKGRRFGLVKLGGREMLSRTLVDDEVRDLGFKFPAADGAILLWQVDPKPWFASMAKTYDGIIAYVLNHESQKVYDSGGNVTDANFLERQLVQEFVKSPIARGQLEIRNKESGDAYGMFHQIGDSNLVIFKEVPKATVMEPLRQMGLSIAVTMVTVLLFGLLMLQIPMMKLVTPLKQLVDMAQRIARGDLTVRPVVSSFGEVGILMRSFQTMVEGLVARDRAIEKFVEDQKEAVRLQGELKVAQGIQDALLPKAIDLSGTGIELFTHYSPAAECAGDWYSYDYREETGELIVAIADVSGHGAGSAMFTAVIAGLFEQARLEGKQQFDTLGFFEKLNKVMFKMGRAKWHTTFTVIRHVRGTDEVEVSNAGGTPLFMMRQESGNGIAKAEVLPSDLIGLAETASFARKTFKFGHGATIFLYTDGLTEASNPADKMYGRKALKKVLEATAALTPDAVVHRVLSDWTTYRAEIPPDDDVCVIALRRA